MQHELKNSNMKLLESDHLVENLKTKLRLSEEKFALLSQEHQEIWRKLMEHEKFEEAYNKFNTKIKESFPDYSVDKFFQKFEYLENVCLDLTKYKLELEDDQLVSEKDKQKMKTTYDNLISDLNKETKDKEKFIKTLQDSQAAKNLEFEANFSYKSQYMNLFKRILQLYAKWSDSLTIYSTSKDGLSARDLNSPEEILDIMEKMVLISTPQSAQAYIRKIMASALRLLRRLVPEKVNEIYDPEKIYDYTAQYVDKLINEIKKSKNELTLMKQHVGDRTHVKHHKKFGIQGKSKQEIEIAPDSASKERRKGLNLNII